MRVTFLATGKNKDKSIDSLCKEYLKRIKAFAKPELIEIPQAQEQSAEGIKSTECKAQLSKVPNNSFVVAMDERGENIKTLEFAKRIESCQISGKSHIVFILGGAEGLHDDIRKRADLVLSMGKMTMPHMLARVMIIEQVYRAFSVISGHPYHRE